jgi:hypothetical protein
MACTTATENMAENVTVAGNGSVLDITYPTGTTYTRRVLFNRGDMVLSGVIEEMDKVASDLDMNMVQFAQPALALAIYGRTKQLHYVVRVDQSPFYPPGTLVKHICCCSSPRADQQSMYFLLFPEEMYEIEMINEVRRNFTRPAKFPHILFTITPTRPSRRGQ